MIVEQIIDIPANRRITLEIPKTIPEGKAILTFKPANKTQTTVTHNLHIEDIRKLLQKEMIDKGTVELPASNGDGWEAHVRERYAES
ncbi:MAG: hypothetical protein FWD47_03615 [Treponema sp.]|nr:hypothetical protein [Treponema sp.]